MKATKTGFFVASDFAHVYMNGGWIGGTPAVNTAVPALFLDDFNAVNGDLNVAGKVVKGVSIRTGTLVGVAMLGGLVLLIVSGFFAAAVFLAAVIGGVTILHYV